MTAADLWIWLLAGAAGGVAFWLLCAGIAAAWAHRRGGPPQRWILYGVLLGPVAIWLVWAHARDCPSCGARVLNEIRTCPGCGADIPRRDPADNPPGPLWTYRKNW